MSSKRHLRRKQCESKRRYTTEADAWREAYRLRSRFNEGGLRDGQLVGVYACGNHFHVGHKTQAQRRADVHAGREPPPHRRA